MVTPVAMLKGFDKIALQPGEERQLTFTIPYKELGLWNAEMKYVVEPGRFTVKIGRSWDDIRLKGSFVVE
ncbi:MAG: fibronectin type III-like domain-contianing protein [Bacteroides sp.]